ncbi:hypothetical protein FDG95_gp514 [Pectobacterium phage vB_PcaM_CBB]|uniref:Uncharacterized protein n=1 Tax=Pectobacterium phage vB_PcaM_CBB TaxID=2772511 RepID=A0A1L2CVI4_9CAUD|nr:hypothetical protein FDG95_gp514 [Pectobacterium phage vB_PcaM_CBB]AMM44028.1 hypothetical protein CBB_465 [Pectobacterium phage vB_PcaM_CBB]
MSISASIDFKIIQKSDFDGINLIREIQTFIERIQRLSYYTVEFDNDLNYFSIFYDRWDHVNHDHIKQSISGLHSFDLEYKEHVYDGSTEPYTIRLVKGTGECINQMIKYYPWLEIEDESVQVEDLHE